MAKEGGLGRKKNRAGKKKGPGTWCVRCNNPSKVSGYTDVSFHFLRPWLTHDLATRALTALRRFAAGYRSPVTVYNTRVVLLELQRLQPHGEQLVGLDQSKLISTLAELRLRLFQTHAASGRKLMTTAGKWNDFCRCLKYFIGTKFFPPVDLRNPRIRQVPESLVSVSRADSERVEALPTLAPKTLDRAGDSYNETLFESISIVASSVDYLEEYERRLRTAIDQIRKVALNEFHALEQKESEARRLMATTRHLLPRPGSANPMLQALSLAEIQAPDKRELTIGLLLHLVHKKMRGAPRAWAKDRTYADQIPADVDRSDCQKLATFGKNDLLPYLGILTTESALVCMMILMLEHPKLNTSTILRAELISQGGRQLVTTQTVLGNCVLRFTGTKPRAHEEKSVLLSPLASRVIQKVLEWTRIARSELKASGDEQAANRLWVGMTLRDYKFRAFSASALTAGFQRNQRTLGQQAEPTRLKSLIEKYPELEPWATKLNLKNLRKNLGVLRYLESGGDAAQAAEVFGNQVQTTLDDYIPKLLKEAIYERQIRRHQNLLISASFGKDGPPLEATDFTSTEELHRFLLGAFKSLDRLGDQPIASAIAEYLERPTPLSQANDGRSPAQPKSSGRLVLNKDPKFLGIAMLYRDHLRSASADQLDRVDPGCGIAPRFWVDFIDLLIDELPNAQSQIKHVVNGALAMKPALSTTISFPRLW